MEIFLSKLIPLFVYPAGLLFCLLVAAFLLLLARRYRAAQVLVVGAMVLLFGAGHGWTAHILVRSLENDYPPRPVDEIPPADVIVVMGGGLGLPQSPRLYPDLDGSSDRLLHALRLYRAGKAEHLLLTGGNTFHQPGMHGESYYARELLALWGVPGDAMLVEAESRNTIENAEYSARMLRDRQWDRILLVTSAAHMHRSVLAFRHAGIEVTPVPVDFRAVAGEAPEVLTWIPGTGGLAGTTQALHEYLGRLWYRLRL